jgi:hypothetical protein
MECIGSTVDGEYGTSVDPYVLLLYGWRCAGGWIVPRIVRDTVWLS